MSTEEFETLRNKILKELTNPSMQETVNELTKYLQTVLISGKENNYKGKQGRCVPAAVDQEFERKQDLMKVLRLGKLLSNASQRLENLEMPHRIILVRHGQSLGNVDEATYQTIPDHKISITAKGVEEARACGTRLRALVGDESIKFFYSPYKRTCQTMEHIVAGGFGDKVNEIIAIPDSRLREQEFANFQNQQEMRQSMNERAKYGRFYYRFSHGESGADVFDRVTPIIHSIKHDMAINSRLQIKNVILVTHGLTMRLFLMRFLGWTVNQFENVWNPDNCAAWILERRDPLSSKFTVASGQPIFYGHNKCELPAEMTSIPDREPNDLANLPPRRRFVMTKNRKGETLVSLASRAKTVELSSSRAVQSTT